MYNLRLLFRDLITDFKDGLVTQNDVLDSEIVSILNSDERDNYLKFINKATEKGAKQNYETFNNIEVSVIQ